MCDNFPFTAINLFDLFIIFSDFTGFALLEKPQLELRLVEKIGNIEYGYFTNAMERLIKNPYSYKCKEFIDQYTKPLINRLQQLEIPKPHFDEEGRQYITTYGRLFNKLLKNFYSTTYLITNILTEKCKHIL